MISDLLNTVPSSPTNPQNEEPQQSSTSYIKTFPCQTIPKSILNDKQITSIIKNPQEVSRGLFESKYIQYEIYTEQFNWLVHRRYSDFIWLRECLRMLYPAELVPILPKKKMGNRRFEEDFIKKRMNQLQEFLNLILENENFKSCSPLIIFISIADRSIFEDKMNQMVPSPFPSIDALMNFEGNVKILDFENSQYKFQESFYKNVNTFYTLQNESLKDLNKNLNKYFEYINLAGNCLINIQEIFDKLTQLNTQAKISTTMSRAYDEFSQFFKNYARIQNNQAFIINEHIKPFFRKMNMVTSPFIELIEQQEQAKVAYNNNKEVLDAKKENLWKLNDINKWEMNELGDTIDTQRLFKDKAYALSKMCYKETDVLNKLYAKLGYFYYYNNEQFTHITETFDTQIQNVMKVFTAEIGATVTDTVQIYQELASVQF